MAKKKKTKKKKAAKKKPIESSSVTPKITPYPRAGPIVTDFEEQLDRQLAGGDPKRGRGRPRKEPGLEPERKDQATLQPAVVAGVVKIPFDLWSISQGIEELALSDQEANQLSGPVKQLLDHYVPQMPEIAYAWIALTVNGFWIMRTRMLLIAAIKQSDKKAQQTDVKDGGQGGPRPSGQSTKQGVNIKQIKPQKIDG